MKQGFVKSIAGEQISHQDVIVLVGPSESGKTSFLQDVMDTMTALNHESRFKLGEQDACAAHFVRLDTRFEPVVATLQDFTWTGHGTLCSAWEAETWEGIDEALSRPYDFIRSVFPQWVPRYELQELLGETYLHLSLGGSGQVATTNIAFSLYSPDAEVATVVCFDEPETALRDAHSRQIGSRIVEVCRGRKQQVFLATHNGSLLRGLLDHVQPECLLIVRLSNGEAHISRLSETTIANMLRDPMIRCLEPLDALFHRKVVFCEGESDILFFRLIFEKIVKRHEDWVSDVHFISMSGKAKLHKILPAMRQFRVDAFFIVDFDWVNEFNQSIADQLHNYLSPKANEALLLLLENKTSLQLLRKKLKQNGMKAFDCEYENINKDECGSLKVIAERVLRECEKERIFILECGELEKLETKFDPIEKKKWLQKVIPQLDTLMDDGSLKLALSLVDKIAKEGVVQNVSFPSPDTKELFNKRSIEAQKRWKQRRSDAVASKKPK